MIKNQNGNILVYILIAVALLGALTFAISRSSSQTDTVGELTEGQAKIMAGEIIAYAASASNALTQMQQTGATLAMINYMRPSDVNFNTAPTIYKLYHPDGGGLSLKPLPARANADDGLGLASGYYVGRFNSFEWTPTTAQDVIFAAFEIKEAVCRELNKRVAGISTIPTATGDTLQNFFVDATLHSGTNVNFQIANCPACDGLGALCVTDGSNKYTFYTILEAE